MHGYDRRLVRGRSRAAGVGRDERDRRRLAQLARDPRRTRRRRRRRRLRERVRVCRRPTARPIGARRLPAPDGARSRRRCGRRATTSTPACRAQWCASASSSSRGRRAHPGRELRRRRRAVARRRTSDRRRRRRARSRPRTAARDRGATRDRAASSRGSPARDASRSPVVEHRRERFALAFDPVVDVESGHGANGTAVRLLDEPETRRRHRPVGDREVDDELGAMAGEHVLAVAAPVRRRPCASCAGTGARASRPGPRGARRRPSSRRRPRWSGSRRRAARRATRRTARAPRRRATGPCPAVRDTTP